MYAIAFSGNAWMDSYQMTGKVQVMTVCAAMTAVYDPAFSASKGVLKFVALQA